MDIVVEWVRRADEWARWIETQIGWLPSVALAAVFAIPVLISLLSRSIPLIAAVAFLDLAAVGFYVQGVGGSTSLIRVVLFASALALACHGFEVRRRREQMRRMARGLNHIDQTLARFLDALDRRSQQIDEQARQLAARPANSSARSDV